MNHPIDSSTANLADILTLARTLYGEARGEGDKGMIAVGFVMRNRMWDNRWPNDIAAVCRQPMQFSCWNEGDPNKDLIERVTLAEPAFISACAIAFGFFAGQYPYDDDITNGADHYMTTDLFYSLNAPTWAAQMRVTAQIGKHVFMR